MSAQVQYSYTPISIPQSALYGFYPSSGSYISVTIATGINDNGDIVGTFAAGSQYYVGSVLQKSLNIVGNFFDRNIGGNTNVYTLEARYSANPAGVVSVPTDINNSGKISTYSNFKGQLQLSSDSGINDLGQTVHGIGYNGEYGDQDINNNGYVIGFNFDDKGIAYSYIYNNDYYSMIRVPASSDTKAYALNDIGQIVGTYTDATGTHGFIGTAGGFQKLTLPDGTDVSPTGINNLGQIVANTQQGGFLLSPITTKTSNTIVLKISQDAYKGDAQFIVKVNGEEVGDVQTVHASHASGQWDTITLQSTVSDPTQVQIQFINDLYEWSPSADRNLYVQSLTFDGRTFDAKSAANTAGHNVTDAAALLGNGTLTFKHVQDTLKLRVAEDNYMGDAKFIVTVDGVQVGGVQTAHASHAEGQWEDITLTGDFGHANRVAVQFINDANGGPGLDRNLYIDSINLNGTTYKGSDASVPHGLGQTAYSAELWTNASAVFSTGPDSVVFRVAEDAYKGDAQFIVKVDGQQVGGVQTAHSSHAQGQWEDITLHGSFAGANHVSVEFINDANGGPGQDRNLYIDSISLDGHVVRGTAATVAKGIGQTVYSAELWTNGVADFNVSTLHHADLIA